MNNKTGIEIKAKHLQVGAPTPTAKRKPSVQTYSIDAVAKFHYFIQTVRSLLSAYILSNSKLNIREEFI